MRKLNKNNGITIISLIVTVIIMLILAGVTITMLKEDKIVDYAEKAVGDTQNAIDQEQELINKVGEYLKNKTSGNSGTVTTPGEDSKIPEGLKVGDYVNYTPSNGTYTVASGENGSGYASEQSFTTETGENALQWRVWSIDKEKGTVELISATAAQTSGLTLQGADGYNHAVDILNDLCKALYSNTNGATARSINVEDINAKTTYDYTTYTNYGTVLTPYVKYYPRIYAKELGSTTNGLEETGDLLTGSEGIRNLDGTADYESYTGTSTADILYATITHYKYFPENYIKNLEINKLPKGLINVESKYWVASRCVSADEGSAYFFVRGVQEDGELLSRDLYHSGGDSRTKSGAARPIVSLNSNVSLTLDRTTESVTYWNIEY